MSIFNFNTVQEIVLTAVRQQEFVLSKFVNFHDKIFVAGEKKTTRCLSRSLSYHDCNNLGLDSGATSNNPKNYLQV